MLTSDRIPEVIRKSWKKTLHEIIKYKISPSLDQTVFPYIHMAESLLGNPALSLPHTYAFVHVSAAVQCQR